MRGCVSSGWSLSHRRRIKVNRLGVGARGGESQTGGRTPFVFLFNFSSAARGMVIFAFVAAASLALNSLGAFLS